MRVVDDRDQAAFSQDLGFNFLPRSGRMVQTAVYRGLSALKL